MQKKVIFLAKHLVFFGLAPSHLATLQYLRTPPVTSLPSVPFPRSYGRKMQPMTINFLLKSTFFAKNCIFFVKYLVMCIFCCTFAPLFRRRDLRAWQKVRQTRLFSSVGQSTWFVISGSLVRIRQEAQEKLNFEIIEIGSIPERPNGADCKSAGFHLRWFESICSHKQKHNRRGSRGWFAEIAQSIEH